MERQSSPALTGNWRVIALSAARHDAYRLMSRAREAEELRRQALKLRFWPENHPADEHGQVLDLDWSWIKALRRHKIGELRVGDVIGGHDNLRVIFHVGDPDVRRPLPLIWVLAVMQKKRQEFTKANLDTFRARHQLARKRSYGG